MPTPLTKKKKSSVHLVTGIDHKIKSQDGVFKRKDDSAGYITRRSDQSSSLSERHRDTKINYTRHSIASSSPNHTLRVVFDLEEDGRIIAEIPALPGVMVYGKNKKEAWLKVMKLAISVMADQHKQPRIWRLIAPSFAAA